MGKALSGELSCPCDRSCSTPYPNIFRISPNDLAITGFYINCMFYLFVQVYVLSRFLAGIVWVGLISILPDT